MKGFRANKEGLCAYVHKGARHLAKPYIKSQSKNGGVQSKYRGIRAKLKGVRANRRGFGHMKRGFERI